VAFALVRYALKSKLSAGAGTLSGEVAAAVMENPKLAGFSQAGPIPLRGTQSIGWGMRISRPSPGGVVMARS
jgi:hypothetical protein